MSAGRARRARGVTLVVAGALYVIAWTAGLAITPGERGGSSAVAVQAHLDEHTGALVGQSLLVHGLAGAALGVLAVGLAAAFARSGSRVAMTVALSGSAAALLSFVQVGLLLGAVGTLAGSPPSRTAAMLGSVDTVDTAKLAALAAFALLVAAQGRRAAVLGRVTGATAAVLAVLLILGAASFIVASPLLSAALVVSLPLLLAWVAAVTVVTARRHPGAATAGPDRHARTDLERTGVGR